MADKGKADQDGPFKEFVFEEWLKDGIDGVRGKMEQRKAHFDPAKFRQHIRAAQKEQLLAIRSLIDSAIEWVDKESKSSD